MAAEQGQAAMVKDSTRPRSSPGRVSKFFTDAVLTERQRLKSEGKDFGADSVLFSLGHQGLEGLPSRSTVVRIFDRAHVVDRNRKKRPKRSHRRFAAKFPNQRWQSDAFTEKLTGGEEVTVIEILDDAARFSLKISVAQSESSDPIVAAFKEAIETHGKPVLVHTDNGSAYNTQRWNRRTALVDYLHDLGIKTITGRPENPKSQGKVERSQCATRRVAISPTQSGQTRREVCGSDGLPGYRKVMGTRACQETGDRAQVFGTVCREGPRDMAKA